MIKRSYYGDIVLAAVGIVLLVAVAVFGASQQTSSTTAQTIINDARYLLNESSASFWDDIEMLQWVNDGMVDLVTRTHCLETTESVTLAASTIEYAISGNYIKIKAVHYNDADSKVWGLKKGSPEHLGSDAYSRMRLTKPSFWYDWGGNVGVYPPLACHPPDCDTDKRQRHHPGDIR
jgi:hypothetical protein